MPPAPPEPPAQRTRVVRRLFSLAWAYKGECVAALAVQTLLVALSIAGLGISGLAIDTIRHAVEPSAPLPKWPWGSFPPSAWTSMQLVLVAGGLVFAIAVVRAVLTWVYAVTVAHLVQVKIVPALRNEVYAKLQRMSFRFFDATASGAIINRVTGDVQNVRAFVDQVLLQGLALALGLCLSVAYMVEKHVGLTVACLASAPLVAMTSLRFSRQTRPAYERARALLDHVVTVVAESIQGIAVVKGFAREPERREVFERASQDLAQQQSEVFRRVSTFAPTIDLLSQMNLVVLLAWGGHLVMANQLTLGDAIVFAGLLQQYASQVANIANIVNSLQQSLISAERVFHVLDTRPEVEPPAQPRLPERFSPRIELEALRFSYSPNEPALCGIDLTIEEGSTVVLFGETGSGKSTLLALLPRFYDATAGCIKISGQDVRHYDLAQLRERIGFMFQESVLFSTTIADNISFGAPDATDARIEAAAQLAAATGFISRLTGGYESHLEEGGRNLSGGERQRLALARALLPNPSILLLDDPTSALDAETEREVIAALSRAAVGRTTVIATHRLPLCQLADRIVVLDRGRIIEQGTHAQLAAQGGAYAHALALAGFADVAPRPAAGAEAHV